MSEEQYDIDVEEDLAWMHDDSDPRSPYYVNPIEYARQCAAARASETPTGLTHIGDVLSELSADISKRVHSFRSRQGDARKNGPA